MNSTIIRKLRKGLPRQLMLIKRRPVFGFIRLLVAVGSVDRVR
jgi:hypothetical protein